MPYGDISVDAPLKPNKGQEGGACNVRSCQAEPANFYNHGSYSWYCEGCKDQIGNDPVNLRNWKMRWEPKLGHPMFETREQMDAREARKMSPDEHIKKITHPLFNRSYHQPKQQSSSLQRMLKAAKTRR